MALLRQAYSALFRRTSTFALTIVLGAVLFERAFDQGADAIFEHLNEGVREGGDAPRAHPGIGPALKVRPAPPGPGPGARTSGCPRLPGPAAWPLGVRQALPPLNCDLGFPEEAPSAKAAGRAAAGPQSSVARRQLPRLEALVVSWRLVVRASTRVQDSIRRHGQDGCGERRHGSISGLLFSLSPERRVSQPPGFSSLPQYSWVLHKMVLPWEGRKEVSKLISITQKARAGEKQKKQVGNIFDKPYPLPTNSYRRFVREELWPPLQGHD
ncbi:hypothetical protein QYF61_018026 [Mycteria americana]|uniref:Cytochrome b-c1 complex subunit 9 n=1 Tax=Mycteria americana TaxID=33587 RepID=A0AAN7MTC0_MYCAM|nr:hypothetical protein QYF61_018026 [Mycteria americana]